LATVDAATIDHIDLLGIGIRRTPPLPSATSSRRKTHDPAFARHKTMTQVGVKRPHQTATSNGNVKP
jgi:hypothetical protein